MPSDSSNSRLYRSFYRNGPDFRDGQDVSFQDILRRYDFTGIRIGRWVTAAEQCRAANLFYDALRDLELILRVPPRVLSLNGTLGLHFAIGGQPYSCAHYEPDRRVLALAKNAGGGSLAHEWFHAFDHYICAHMFRAPGTARAFASRQWLHSDTWHPHPLNTYLHEGFQTLFLAADKTDTSPFMRHCLNVDQQQGAHYFALPEEMAARAFEKVLQSQAQKNHFLVSGTLKSPTAQAGLYPNTTLTAQLADLWLGYFNQLGAALEQQAMAAESC